MQVTQDMLRHVDACLARKMPVEHSRWYQNRTYSLERFVRLTMKEALGMALEASGLPTCSEMMSCIGANDAPIKEWAKASKERGREIDWTNFRTGIKKCASAGEKLFCAYEYLAEPFLTRDYQNGHGKSLPVFITDYPYEVSPLARKKDTDPTLVDRFELFIDGRELCNAFSELNDPEDQAARFQAQVDKKSAGAEETMEYDANYIRALEYGMPPTAGFGMGVDRLVMLLTGASSIRDVILFPLLRNQ
jgi:lysyl-tRNA synthetase class 2